MTPQILIKIDNPDGPDAELLVVRDLIQNELDRCVSCTKIHKLTKLLPYHCNTCFVIRDERWLLQLQRRARSFTNSSAFMTRH
jgi:hypothetical protein